MTATLDTITIPTWANGPDGSGNGGWTAGLLAMHVDADRETVTVNLRVPPPIGRPLQVVQVDGGAELRDGGVVVAQAVAADMDRHVPIHVLALSIDAARAGSDGFPFRHHHPFARCLVCGTERDPALPGFHLQCGPIDGVEVDGAPVFADAWQPERRLHDHEQPDDPEVVSHVACWAALDCPSATPIADPDAAFPSVLARITAWIDQPPLVDDRCIVAAWAVGADGRKRTTRSVLMREGGEVLGIADALWIEVRGR